MSTDPKPKGSFKRDTLLANEVAIQSLWDESNAYESDVSSNKESYMVTFPYPYMNGVLHIGHAFSLTKAVFRAQFERNRGKNVLFPFGFHCTGMPIQAAANKLKTEMSLYGTPPSFPEDDPVIRAKMEADMASANMAKQASQTNEKKAKGGKTKLTAKTGTGIVRQWNILLKMVDEEEIPKFRDPEYWLRYFPPIGVDHMKRFGSGVDWRRSFITTAVNPYYDAFIRWQFNTLRKKDKILYGKRNNVYSILDGQVCADHDRSDGEGVGPQEYTLIKLKVLKTDLEKHAKISALLINYPSKVFLVAATLRPETMYGQTNCFLLPTGEYGAYYIDATQEVFIMSHRSARGLSCQLYSKDPDVYYTKEFAKVNHLETFTGMELMGLSISAPNAVYDKVYTLPLLTISMGKGTGVVTSVPSDAPDDYVALENLKSKPEFAAKYGITPDMVDPFNVVPIIDIPGYGNTSAVFMCEKLKITSFNEKAKLTQAKDETYLKGFNFGVMEVGDYKGQKVCDVKAKIKEDMMKAGQVCNYFEPESKVMSRTNDECVVASTDQWYLRYGQKEWSEMVLDHIHDPKKFNAYESLSKYDYTVNWLKEWACTRQFGLGTKLPWDTDWVIESLSDSTIYMAYYTIAHVLQGPDNLNGEAHKNPYQIDPANLTDDVFDYIFTKAPAPLDSPISLSTLDKMRDSFRYWYPMDLRVSAKDLIPNHLTMALYNHAAIWDDEPELWPKGYYTNGHVLVDAEKMSKSKGNFLMMDETISKFTADATRFACADAGDSMDDANFARETADMAILSLSNEMEWILEVLKNDDLRAGEDDLNFMDRVLKNEIYRLVQITEVSFENMQFREGLKTGWFEMLRARNEYRSWCEDSGIPMNKDLVKLWIDSVLILICPICPHWSENLWRIIGKQGLAIHAPWPIVLAPDKLLTRQTSFLRDSLKSFRAQASKAKKGCTNATIVVSNSYPQWKTDTLLWMQTQYVEEAFSKDFMKDLKKWSAVNIKDKKLMKFTMQFASWIKKEVEDVGAVAMDITLPYDQNMILSGSDEYIKKQLKLGNVPKIITLDVDVEGAKEVPDRVVQNVNPGKPYLWLH